MVIDECHRVPDDEDSSYRRVISHLQSVNPGLKILGLTATPYRLGLGWIYRFHTRGQVRTTDNRFFKDCIFELPIRHLLDEGFLTEATLLDAPVLSYDFSELRPRASGFYSEKEMDEVIKRAPRATPEILTQIKEKAADRHGIMIFAATVRHAQEVLHLLPPEQSALVVGDTEGKERDRIIRAFKNREIKYLVNVSVLTTGFDAPHVDLIAILRPTESVSLYQQIVGRGLRLSPGKKDCLILDYAGNNYDLYQPEVGDTKPDSDSEIVTIPCPACGSTTISGEKRMIGVLSSNIMDAVARATLKTTMANERFVVTVSGRNSAMTAEQTMILPPGYAINVMRSLLTRIRNCGKR